MTKKTRTTTRKPRRKPIPFRPRAHKVVEDTAWLDDMTEFEAPDWITDGGDDFLENYERGLRHGKRIFTDES